MKNVRRVTLLLFTLALMALFSMVALGQADINWFKGNVSIDGSSSTVNGAVVEAFSGSTLSSSYTIGSLNIQPHNYSLSFQCTSGTAITLKVWGISGPSQTCNNLLINTTNITVNLVANDGACSYGNACSSGFCCSGNTAVNTSAGSGACQAVACGTGITIPGFSLSASTITTSGKVNFTINITSVLRYNITTANFTLVTGSTVVSRNFTIPSNSRNLNISYKIFESSETASAGTYNITAIQVDDNGSIVNRTAITNMNFTVTAVPAPAADTGGGGASAGAGGGGGAAAPAPAPAAPSQETIGTVKESLPEAFKEAAAAGNVEIKTVAAPEVKEVAVAPEAVTKILAQQVETIVKTEEAKQALNAIQEAVSSGGASTVSVKKTIEVVKATNTVTKEEVIVSVVKLAVTAPGNQDLKNVEVVEVIPKAAASNINQVTFKGEKPQVLEADPVVKWFFSQVNKGTTKDLSYTVNKDIRNIGTTTIGVQGRAEAAPAAAPAPPAPEAKEKEKPAGAGLPAKVPTPASIIVLVIVVAVVAVGAWLFIKSRKKVMK